MRAIALVAAAAIAGCGPAQGASDNRSAADEPLVWQDAPGGGWIARWEFASDDVGYRSTDVVRCWPSAGRQDCLAVSETSPFGYSAKRFSLPTLPTTKAALQAATPAEGYSCGYVPDHSMTVETITGARGKLVEQSWLSFAPKRPWTRTYVTRFLHDNGVGGANWFRCVDLTRQLRNGSLATIGTTALTNVTLQ